MSQEALVIKSTGYISVVKPGGAIWGSEELNSDCFIVKKINDPSLDFGDKTIIVHPYRTTEPFTVRGKTSYKEVKMSEYKINPDADDSTPLEKDSADFYKEN